MSILSSAVDVLRCFSSTRHDVTVTDLVTLLGMPKSNASRLLRAMRDEGLLETVGESKRYRPSLLLNPHSPSKSLILLSGSQYFRYKSWC
ncbi:MAG: helix-turn-helix domain-containing protein [Proteobacteria bacterium]|nr:helix-turn-helix domain-containing protein [Pseudomonadota bacterium]